MKNIPTLLILSFCLILMSNTCRKKEDVCEGNSHNELTVQNNSFRNINFEIYWNYPDTFIGEYNPKGFGVITSGSNRGRGAGPGSCWESVLSESRQEFIYIFDEDSLQNIPWDSVRATNRGLLERRTISLQYLIDNNFVVTYP